MIVNKANRRAKTILMTSQNCCVDLREILLNKRDGVCCCLSCINLFRKNLLLEAANYSDLTSEKYVELQKQINSALQSVNSSDEYRDFAEKHR
jgi:hypothetical protein